MKALGSHVKFVRTNSARVVILRYMYVVMKVWMFAVNVNFYLGGQSVSNKLLWQPSDCITICYDWHRLLLSEINMMMMMMNKVFLYRKWFEVLSACALRSRVFAAVYVVKITHVRIELIKFIIKSRRTRWSLTPPNIIQIVCSKNKWHST